MQAEGQARRPYTPPELKVNRINEICRGTEGPIPEGIVPANRS
jgi:hypothetical protein